MRQHAGLLLWGRKSARWGECIASGRKPDQARRKPGPRKSARWGECIASGRKPGAPCGVAARRSCAAGRRNWLPARPARRLPEESARPGARKPESAQRIFPGLVHCRNGDLEITRWPFLL